MAEGQCQGLKGGIRLASGGRKPAKGLKSGRIGKMYIPLLQASFDHPSAFMGKNIWKRKMQSVMLKWELVELKPAANFLPGKGTVTVPGHSLQSGWAVPGCAAHG